MLDDEYVDQVCSIRVGFKLGSRFWDIKVGFWSEINMPFHEELLGLSILHLPRIIFLTTSHTPYAVSQEVGYAFLNVLFNVLFLIRIYMELQDFWELFDHNDGYCIQLHYSQWA